MPSIFIKSATLAIEAIITKSYEGNLELLRIPIIIGFLTPLLSFSTLQKFSPTFIW